MSNRFYFLTLAATSVLLRCSPSEPEQACLNAAGAVVSCDEPGATFVPTDLVCQDGSGNEHPIELCQQQVNSQAGTQNSTAFRGPGFMPLFFFWGAGGSRYPAMGGYPQVPYSPQYRNSVPSSYNRMGNQMVPQRSAPTTRSGFGNSGRRLMGGS